LLDWVSVASTWLSLGSLRLADVEEQRRGALTH